MSQDRKLIFVSGEWQPEAIKGYTQDAFAIGKLLAQNGYNVTCGPGTGIAKHVLEGYLSVSAKRRGEVFFYLPKESDMIRVGEKMEHIPNIIIETREDYPTRNVIQVRSSDALIAITGAAGTVTEIIHACDFQRPVAILDKSGPMADAIKLLPRISNSVFFSTDPKELVNYIKEQLLANPRKNRPEPIGPSIVVST